MCRMCSQSVALCHEILLCGPAICRVISQCVAFPIATISQIGRILRKARYFNMFVPKMYFPRKVGQWTSQKWVCQPGKILVSLQPPFCPRLAPPNAHIRQNPKNDWELILTENPVIYFLLIQCVGNCNMFLPSLPKLSLELHSSSGSCGWSADPGTLISRSGPQLHLNLPH